MNEFWSAVLPYLIPSTIALIGVLVGHALLRRSSSQTNNTTAFDVVTNKLMKLVEDADRRILKLEGEVKELQDTVARRDEENAELHEENSRLHREVSEIRAEFGEVKRLNTSLGAYVGKLIRLWPVGFQLPAPDDGLDFTAIPLYPSIPARPGS